MLIVAQIPKNPASKAKFTQNIFLLGIFTPFTRKSFQIWDHFFPLLFSKDSKNQKSLDIGLWEKGTNRRLNGVNKWRKKHYKKIVAAILHSLWATVFKFETTSFHYFPQGFRKSKKFAHLTLRSGGKRLLKGVRNTNTKKNPAQ